AALDGDTYVISGKTRKDLNVDFPEVMLPAMAPVSMRACNITNNGIRYDFDFPMSGDYIDSACNLNGKSLYVRERQIVNLQITRNTTLNALCVAGSGNIAGKLTMYMTNASFTFGG